MKESRGDAYVSKYDTSKRSIGKNVRSTKRSCFGPQSMTKRALRKGDLRKEVQTLRKVPEDALEIPQRDLNGNHRVTASSECQRYETNEGCSRREKCASSMLRMVSSHKCNEGNTGKGSIAFFGAES